MLRKSDALLPVLPWLDVPFTVDMCIRLQSFTISPVLASLIYLLAIHNILEPREDTCWYYVPFPLVLARFQASGFCLCCFIDELLDFDLNQTLIQTFTAAHTFLRRQTRRDASGPIVELSKSKRTRRCGSLDASYDCVHVPPSHLTALRLSYFLPCSSSCFSMYTTTGN